MASFISSLTFQEEWRCFASGVTFEFRPGVTLLVGDQGSGKSSLLSALVSRATASEPSRRFGSRRSVDDPKVSVARGPDAGSSVRVLNFDFEKSNPRTLSYFSDNMAAQVQMMFSSHGEAVLALLSDVARQCRDTQLLMLFDEPDMALSPVSAHRLAGLFADVVAAGAQVVASVHNPIVIAAFDEVLCLDGPGWVPSAQFLAAAEREAAALPRLFDAAADASVASIAADDDAASDDVSSGSANPGDADRFVTLPVSRRGRVAHLFPKLGASASLVARCGAVRDGAVPVSSGSELPLCRRCASAR